MESPLSFRSARSSPVREINSSPASPGQEGLTLPCYRAVKQLPYELREHCCIYFEEGLYTQALNLLISLISSGTGSLKPALLPPPQHLALAATLAVHPALTTRAKSIDHLQASNLALRYLRLVLKLTGPIHANLKDAFTLSGIGNSTRRSGGGRRKITDENHFQTDDCDINSELATTGSLWWQVEDLWQIVGWAFNCSVRHARRWERWSVWLEFMVQVLEKDWETRWIETEQSDAAAEEDMAPLRQSMIVRYLSADTLTTGHERKVLRAIFADATTRSLSEFPEIWKNETKARKQPASSDPTAKRTESKIDIAADNYGDYLLASSSSDLEDPSSHPPSPLAHPPPQQEETPHGAASLGGMQALTLRLRLLSLLATVSVLLPSSFLPLKSLYDHLHSFIRPLPLPTFFIVLSPLALTSMTAAAASTLTQSILRSLLASAAPLAPDENLEQKMLERYYLPFAANTQSVAENAKVSLCLETLVRLYDKHCGLVWSEALQEAVEKGIEAREMKARKEGRKGRGLGVGGEKVWLKESAERMRACVEICRLRSEKQ